ncbi:vitamin K epoxide reductase [Pelagophyceae sp. CCMP2097]|nr:vitamin K epoxide reductase [Pelagophyceae sp. CCMP2097]
MRRYEGRVVGLGVCGVAVSVYALYVEWSMAANPFYEPACVTRWGSCATVFSSDYAHLLSHWGLVERHSPLDLSLASLGCFNYGLYVLYPAWRSPKLLLLIASGSCGFSVYLLYVLKFVLRDFCVVCTTFHAINFSMLLFGARPMYSESMKNVKKA